MTKLSKNQIALLVKLQTGATLSIDFQTQVFLHNGDKLEKINLRLFNSLLKMGALYRTEQSIARPYRMGGNGSNGQQWALYDCFTFRTCETELVAIVKQELGIVL